MSPAPRVLLFSHLGHVGKCVLREMAGCPSGESAKLGECYRQGLGLFLLAGLWIAAKSPFQSLWAPRACRAQVWAAASFTYGDSTLWFGELCESAHCVHGQQAMFGNLIYDPGSPVPKAWLWELWCYVFKVTSSGFGDSTCIRIQNRLTDLRVPFLS